MTRFDGEQKRKKTKQQQTDNKRGNIFVFFFYFVWIQTRNESTKHFRFKIPHEMRVHVKHFINCLHGAQVCECVFDWNYSNFITHRIRIYICCSLLSSALRSHCSWLIWWQRTEKEANPSMRTIFLSHNAFNVDIHNRFLSQFRFSLVFRRSRWNHEWTVNTIVCLYNWFSPARCLLFLHTFPSKLAICCDNEDDENIRFHTHTSFVWMCYRRRSHWT